MAHKRFEFGMPANAAVVFDAFHYHCWRSRWDSLVSEARVQGGGPCPYVGAVTENAGAGVLRALSMRTEFLAYDRPRIAAASMVGHSFPFRRWAASIRHRAAEPGRSVLVYTYNFEAGPRALRWLIEPVVVWMFDRQTRKRFSRLAAFLERHAEEIECWQTRARESDE
ncbi:MAG: SRPBCC family protein [Methylobacillus sp.]|jgi:hypothetical protein|nr:SRPBCC family protein [Methylobacillus sp.]